MGGGSLSREVIDGGVLLVESFLASFGHLRDVPAPTRPAPLLHVPDQDHWIKVSADGVFSPMVMPGECIGDLAAPYLGYLQALRAWDRRFPGFGHDTHGVEVEDGEYYLYCLK